MYPISNLHAFNTFCPHNALRKCTMAMDPNRSLSAGSRLVLQLPNSEVKSVCLGRCIEGEGSGGKKLMFRRKYRRRRCGKVVVESRRSKGKSGRRNYLSTTSTGRPTASVPFSKRGSRSH